MKSTLRGAGLVLAVVLAGAAQPVRAQQTEKAAFTVDDAKAKTGLSLFAAKGCAACHTVGKGRTIGPDLKGLLERRELAWVQKWMTQTDQMLESDPIAKEMLKEANGIRMPQLPLTPAEVEALIHYIVQEGNKSK